MSNTPHSADEVQRIASGTPSSTAPLTVVWLVLLALSTLNYYLAEDALTGRPLVAVVFGAVFIKLALVISTFMELRTHGRAWLLPALGLMALVCGVLTLAW
jgi:cytochrome c oxidase subunit IV